MTSKYKTEIDLSDKNSSHTLITEFVGPDKRVLDVGCAAGDLAGVLGERGCSVTGIEIDPEAGRQAEESCEKVIVGDVENPDAIEQLDDESFDVIVFGDVLEHLKDPLQTLRRLKPLLSPEGYVVASIPNISHGSVRLALMQGNFQYRQLGLLDDSHLRFYTRESIEELFTNADLLITGLKRTTRDIFDTEVEFDKESVSEEALREVRVAPEAKTYQFVVTAHRDGELGALAKRNWLLQEELAERDRVVSEQLAERDQVIQELNMKLGNLKKLQRMLQQRDRELNEREQEVEKLMEELADRNDRLAKLVQFGKDKA